ncbi:uncharacterized protein LOC115471410 isoform X2 [Microcaecilia unicolor]|nr:uncharacterized protein LOC115471410 isoform X2 [Microcaecilia unicolor]
MTSDLPGDDAFCPSGNSSLFESSVKSGLVEKPMQNEAMKLENESTMVMDHETSDIPGDDSNSSLVSNEESILDVANKTYTLLDNECEDLWVSGISNRSSVGMSQELVPLKHIPETETGKKYVTEVDFLLTLDEKTSASTFEIKPTGKENFHVTYSPLKKRNIVQGNRTDSSRKYLHNWLHDAPLSPSNAEMINKMRSFIGRHKRSLEPQTYMSSDGRFHHSKDELYGMPDRTRNLCEVQTYDGTFGKTSLEKASDSLEMNDVTLVDLYPGMIQSLSRLMDFARKKRAADDIVKHYKRSIWNVNKMKLNITKERLTDFHPVKSRWRKTYISPDTSKSKEISFCLNESTRTSPEGQNLKQSWLDSGASYSVTLNALDNGLEHSESQQINACLQPSPVKKDSGAACYRATNAFGKRIESWKSPQDTARFLSVRQNASPKTTSVLMEETYIIQSPLQTFESWGLPERDRSKKQFDSPSQQQSSLTRTIGSSSRPFILEKGEEKIQTCSPLKPLTEKNMNHRFGFAHPSVNLTSTFLSNLVEDYNSFKSVPLQRRHSCSALPIKQSPVKAPLSIEDTFGELYRKLVLKQHISPLDKRRILSSRRLEAIHSSKIVDALVNSPLQKRVKRRADFYSDDDSSMSGLKRPRNVLEHFTSNTMHHQPSIRTNIYDKQYGVTSSQSITKNLADIYDWKFQRMMPEYANGFYSNRRHELLLGVSSPPVFTDTSSNKYVSPRRIHDINIRVSRKLSYTGKQNPGSSTYMDGFQV